MSLSTLWQWFLKVIVINYVHFDSVSSRLKGVQVLKYYKWGKFPWNIQPLPTESKKLKIGHKSVSGDIPRIMCYFQTFQSHYQLRFSQQRTDPIYIYCNINVSYSDSAQPIFTLIPNWEILLSISAFGELRKQPLVGTVST